MAKKSEPVALVKLSAFGDFEVRFGKGDKIQKLAIAKNGEGWKLADIEKDLPEGVLYVSKTGATFIQDISRYPENIKAVLFWHGTKQKTGDEYADLDHPDDCMEAVREMDSRLADGKFFAERQGFAGASVLMRAIMKVYGMDEAAVREFLKPLSVKEKQALRVSEELKGAVEEIERERGKGVDTGALLGKIKPTVVELN